jgi:hypothetical protein
MIAKVVNPPSPQDLKRAFETSIVQIGREAQSRSSFRLPIAFHKRAALAEKPSDEQALAEASHALARLWNVSRGLVR